MAKKRQTKSSKQKKKGRLGIAMSKMLHAEKVMEAANPPHHLEAIKEQVKNINRSDYGDALRLAFGKRRIQNNVKAAIRDLTSGYAFQFSCLQRLREDRELDAKKICELMHSVDHGAILFIWAVAVLPDGTVYAINGRRSSAMFAMFPNLVREGMKVVIVEHHVKSYQEAVDLWAKYDKRGPVMTPGTIYRGELFSLENEGLLELTSEPLRALVTVLGRDMFGKVNSKLDPEHRKVVIRKYKKFLEFVVSLIPEHGLPQSLLIKSFTVPVILESWRLDKKLCTEFWTLIACSERDPGVEYEELSKTDPDNVGFYQLNELLRNVRTGAMNMNASMNSNYTQYEPAIFVQARLAMSWNEWIERGILKTVPTPLSEKWTDDNGRERATAIVPNLQSPKKTNGKVRNAA